jgi:hypothetical protein
VREDQYVLAGVTVFALFLAFVGAFAKLRKATISYVMSVRLSFLPSIRLANWRKLGFHCMDFHAI